MCEDYSRTVSVQLVDSADLFSNIYKMTMIGRLLYRCVFNTTAMFCNVLTPSSNVSEGLHIQSRQSWNERSVLYVL